MTHFFRSKTEKLQILSAMGLGKCGVSFPVEVNPQSNPNNALNEKPPPNTMIIHHYYFTHIVLNLICMEQTSDFEVGFPQVLELVLANLPLKELLTSCRYIPALSPSYKLKHYVKSFLSPSLVCRQWHSLINRAGFLQHRKFYWRYRFVFATWKKRFHARIQAR